MEAGVVWIVMWAAASYAADCPSDVRAEQVGGDVEEAMLAFATLDEEGFRASAAKARSDLPCLSELMPSGRIAAYHRMMGVLAFLDADATNAQRSFAAALAIEPSYTLSAKIAPEGGKLWRSYEAARTLSVSEPTSFPAPADGRTYVDGVLGATRVVELPAVVQVLEGSTPTLTAYVLGGAPPPALGGAPVVADPDPIESDLPEDPLEDAVVDAPLVEDLDAPDEPDEPDEPEPPPIEDLDGPTPVAKPPRERGGSGPGMWIGAGATAGTAAALFATSAVTRASFDADPSQTKFVVTNGAYYGSVGAGALSLVLAGLAVGGTF